MPNYDGTGPPGTGACTGRGLGPCGREEDQARSAEDPYWDEGSGWNGRPWGGGRRWAFGPGRKPTQDPGRRDASARQRESFRSGQVEGLLTTELDKMKQALSECLRGGGKEEE